MNKHIDKTPENNSRAVANSLDKPQGNDKSTFQFVDNRPEAMMQRELQKVVNNSPQAKKLNAFQELANNRPMTNQAAQLKSIMTASNRLKGIELGLKNPFKSIPLPSEKGAAIATQGGVQPIQRIIDTNLENFAQVSADIQEAVTIYNDLEPKEELPSRMKALRNVEIMAYSWFNDKDNQSEDLNSNPTAIVTKKLLNKIKEERTRIIEKSLEDDNIGDVNLIPPVAGFDDLDAEKKEIVRNLWQKLVTNEGKIKITETEPGKTPQDEATQHKGFNFLVLTEFSRMLESEFGKNMITKINNSNFEVIIEPFYHNNTSKDLEAGPATDNVEGNLIELDKIPENTDLYTELDMTNLPKVDRLNAINNLERSKLDTLGVCIKDGERMKFYKFGAGTNVRVTMPSDLDDITDHKASRLVSKEDKELIAPMFIGLGHELGHAIHYQRGVATGSIESITEHINIDKENSDNPTDYGNITEEYVNITANENNLRSGYGLGTRKGHGNIPRMLMKKMETIIDSIEEVIKSKIKNIHPDLQKPILKEINGIIRRIGTEWEDPEKLKTLQNDLKDLPSKLDGMANVAIESQNKKMENSKQPPTKDDECFLTTACIRSKGLPDNCEELMILRHFRDTYLANKSNGAELIGLYYKHAPDIVTAIEDSPNANEIYQSIYNTIQLCINNIKNGNNEGAFNSYCQKVIELKKKFLPSIDALTEEDALS